MATESALMIKIGVGLGSSIATLGTVQSSIKKLGDGVGFVVEKQKALGAIFAKNLGTDSIKHVNAEYKKLSATIELLQKHQLKLTSLMQAGDAMKAQRAQMRGDFMGNMALGASMAVPIKIAADFESGVKDIAITGNLNRAEEISLGKSIRQLSLQFNQSQEASIETTKNLIATGMGIQRTSERLPFLLKTQTALNVESKDAAQADYALQLMGVKDLNLAWNQMANSANEGNFELKDMAKSFPVLGAFMTKLGVVGNEAAISLSTRLQISKRTAGTSDEASNNLKNYLTKITSADTINDFKKLHIDLVGSLKDSAAKGTDVISASVGIVMEQLKKSSPAAAAELSTIAKEVANIKDPIERAAELERRHSMIESIGESAGLGTMFQDMQAVQYLLAEIQNGADLKAMQEKVKAGNAKSGKTVIDDAFDKRMATTNEQLKKLKNNLTDLGLSIGDILLPALNDSLTWITPAVKWLSIFTQEHKGLVGGLMKLFAVLATAKITIFVVRYALSLLFGALNGGLTIITQLTSKWALFKALGAKGLLSDLFGGKKGGVIGAATEALGAASVQKVFVVNMGSSGMGGLDDFIDDGKGSRSPKGAKPKGKLGRLWGATKGIGAKLGSLVNKAAVPIAIGASIYAAGSALMDNSLTKKEKGNAIGGAAGSLAGGLAGAKLGALVGTMILPGVGTVIGGLVGGLAGALAGNYLGSKVGGAVTANYANAHPEVASKAAAAAVAAQPKLASIKMEYKPNIVIHGDPTPQTLAKFGDMLKAHQKTIEEMIKRQVAAQQRVAF